MGALWWRLLRFLRGEPERRRDRVERARRAAAAAEDLRKRVLQRREILRPPPTAF